MAAAASSASPTAGDGAIERAPATSDDGSADTRSIVLATRPRSAGQAAGHPVRHGGECASGFCADGVCCSSRLHRRLLDLRGQGAVGTCVTAQLGTDPRDECPVEAASTCGSTGMCDGTGACDKYPAGTVCKEMACSGSTLTLGVPLRRQRRLRADAGPVLRRRSSAATDGRCLTICMSDADWSRPTRCINGSCGKKPIGAHLRRRRRVQLRLLRARRLLRRRLHRHLPVVRGPRQRRDLHQRPRRRQSAGPVRRQGAATCGTDGMLRRQGRPAAATPRGRSAWRRPAPA